MGGLPLAFAAHGLLAMLALRIMLEAGRSLACQTLSKSEAS